MQIGRKKVENYAKKAGNRGRLVDRRRAFVVANPAF